ncbi:MAG TPA: TolC family protein [Bacteroidota bacterium]|jgi:outer membrane protein
MKQMHRRLQGVASLLCLTVFMGAAQPQTLTLEQATQIALEKNIEVAQAQNNIESAQSSVLQSQGSFLPTLSVSGSWNRTQIDRSSSTSSTFGGTTVDIPPQFAVTNSFSTGLNANYVLFDGFSRYASLDQSKSTAVATELTSARTRQTIVFQVERSYLDVLRNQQLVRVTEENLKRDNRQLERITEMNRVGSLSIADVYRQQSQVASDELALITAQNNFEKSKSDLIALIGLNPFDPYEFADASISTDLKVVDVDATRQQYRNVNNLSARAWSARPDYLGAQERLSASESGITQATAGYWPSVNAFAGYGLTNEQFSQLSSNKTINWGVRVQWNLFDGFQTNQAIQSAKVAYRNAEIGIRQTERDINNEIRKALLDLDAAGKQFEVTEKGLISAIEDRKIAEERYNLGAGTLLDLLVANANLVNAEANKVNASYNYVIAKRNVEYVIGEKAR